MAEEQNDVPITGPITRSPQYQSVYVNQLREGMSTWDFQITFGRITEVAPGTPSIEEQFTAVLAPEYVKAVLGALTESVRLFEEKIGPITRSPRTSPTSVSLDAIKAGVQLSTPAEKK